MAGRRKMMPPVMLRPPLPRNGQSREGSEPYQRRAGREGGRAMGVARVGLSLTSLAGSQNGPVGLRDLPSKGRHGRLGPEF